VSLPAVRKDTRFDNLFDDYGGLRSRGLGTNFSPPKINKLTPYVPSSCISLARFTRPYAPLPISRSITNSEMLRSARNALGSLLAMGAPTLATLRKLVALFVRTSLVVAGGGEGGSTWAMETLPAIRETRCCEDRRRGREHEDDAREFLRERVKLEVSGEVLPLIGLRGLDEMGESAGENETESVVRFIAGLLDTTDERREIAGDEGWDIRGEGGSAERLVTDGS